MAPDGSLVLVFDDGYAEDASLVRPVLADAGVAACFAVVPSWVGEDGHLDADGVAALADAGHEVATHGRRHRYLQALHLARDAAAGDRTLRVSGVPGGDHGIEDGDEYEVTDGQQSLTVTLDGVEMRDGESVLTTADPLAEGFDGETTVVRPTPAVLHDEIAGAREHLREFGVDPATFVFPYDAADPRAWRLARESYDVIPDAATRSLPNPPGTDPTNLRRWYLETTHLRPAEVETYLDDVARTGGVGVLAGHSAWDSVTPERIRGVVAAARERGIEVTTFEQLYG